MQLAYLLFQIGRRIPGDAFGSAEKVYRRLPQRRFADETAGQIDAGDTLFKLLSYLLGSPQHAGPVGND